MSGKALLRTSFAADRHRRYAHVRGRRDPTFNRIVAAYLGTHLTGYTGGSRKSGFGDILRRMVLL